MSILLYNIESSVPQCSIPVKDIGPMLYLICTADLPANDNTITATYADDTDLLSISTNPETVSIVLQAHLNKAGEWLRL